MNYANVCRLCRASANVPKTVNMFSHIGIKHKCASRVAPILDIEVQDDDRFSPAYADWKYWRTQLLIARPSGRLPGFLSKP